MAFFADRLGALDRREIRERVIERFSAARMADRYEELYARMIAVAGRVAGGRERAPDAAEVEEALAVQLPVQVTEPADAELPEKRNGATPPEAETTETLEVIALPGPGEKMRPIEAAAEADEVPAREPIEATAEPATEREPTTIEPIDALAEPEEAPEAATPEGADEVEAPEPVAVAAGYQGEDTADRADALEDVARAAASVDAAVIDVVVAPAPEAEQASAAEQEREPAATAEPEPAPIAESAAEEEPAPVAEAAPEPVVDARPELEPEDVAEPLPAIAAQEDAAADKRAARRQRQPVAVGPGPVETEQVETEQAEAKQTEPEPASSTPPPTKSAAGPAEPTRETPKPLPKRANRSISIFKRTWSSGSGKKAAGARRRDRS